MARKKSDTFCPLKSLRVILLLGGESVDGNLVGWFKTAKHRFGLHRFGQATLKGIYRWLVLSLIAYLLAHWAYLSTTFPNLPDWGEAAKLALELFLPQLVVLLLLLEVRRLQSLLRTHSLEIQITRCKI
jgi:hypothetical protein